MDIKNTKQLKQAAQTRLRAAGSDPKLLVLLHTAVALGAGLLITVLDFILTRSIDSTGGLAGLQMRSILSTAQSVLQLASSVLLPFWQIGLLRAAMAFARQETAAPSSLLEGFRRFGPVLRLMALRAMVLLATLMVCVYAGTAIFLATPLARPVTELLAPMLTDASMLTDPTALLDEATMEAITDAILPAIPIVFALFLLLAVPLLYRLRLVNYLILDDPGCGALAAFGKSIKLTKRNAFSLFRVDLSFWWFYVLQGICLAVGYADVVLPLFGIQLPISGDSAFFVAYILSLFLQLVLFWRAGAYLHTTQALAYDTLRSAEPAAEPVPKNVPWNY